tara:strand:- start:1080 stop:1232 length:153 start_codon:yes stop_codon:yes gene_type:complete
MFEIKKRKRQKQIKRKTKKRTYFFSCDHKFNIFFMRIIYYSQKTYIIDKI